jgi:polyhydroxyalkanoate synthesis regulator protein
MEGAFGSGPFGEIARRNMEMFEAATGAFKPGSKEAGEAPEKESEVDALKAQLAQLQDKIDKLSD